MHILLKGTMLNVAGSANDPIFFNHHTMIDCLFEQWMEKHNMSSYPSIEVNPQFAGHGYNDCLVPFIPLYTNADMFMRSTEFGYKCSAAENTLSASMVALSVMLVCLITVYI